MKKIINICILLVLILISVFAVFLSPLGGNWAVDLQTPIKQAFDNTGVKPTVRLNSAEGLPYRQCTAVYEFVGKMTVGVLAMTGLNYYDVIFFAGGSFSQFNTGQTWKTIVTLHIDSSFCNSPPPAAAGGKTDLNQSPPPAPAGGGENIALLPIPQINPIQIIVWGSIGLAFFVLILLGIRRRVQA